MAEKVQVGLVSIFAIAVIASLVIPVWTFELALVTSPPSKHFSVFAGRPFEITCRGESNNNRLFSDMKWLDPKGEALAEGNLGRDKSLTNSLMLKFSAPKASDSGVYKCVALYDNKHSLQTEVTIAFFASLAIPVWTLTVSLVTSPSSKYFSVPAGKPFEITCKWSSGDNRYFSDMKWLFPKGEAVVADRYPGVRIYDSTAEKSLKLQFSTPKTSDSGVYKCVALYENKQSLQTEVTIAFFDRVPAFEKDYKNVAAKEESNLQVLCSAAGEQIPTYRWFNQHQRQIPYATRFPIYVSRSDKGEAILNIISVKTTDAGVYTCKASNDFGFANKSFEITVFAISGNDTSIKKVQAVKVTVNSIVFEIVTSGSEDSIEAEYFESRNSTVCQIVWKRGGVYEIKNLNSFGLYSFRFRTIPSDGNWSKVYDVTLLPDVPNVIFQRLEGNSVKLGWFLKIDDIQRDTIDKYQLTYYTVEMNPATGRIPSKCATTIELPSCLSREYTISGLFSTLYYEIQLRAHTASGFGDPYKQILYIQ